MAEGLTALVTVHLPLASTLRCCAQNQGGITTMPLDTLENVLAHELSDLLSAENQIAKALGQVAKAADSDQVRQMAEQHREETQQQIDKPKQASSVMGQKPEKMVCKGAQGIV